MFESIAAFWAEYGNVLTDGVWDTLVMVVISTAFAYLIGLPLGVALILTQPHGIRPHRGVYRVLDWIVNIGRSVPFIILMGASPALTLIIFAMLPLMIACTRFFNKRMRAVYRESRHQVGEINAQVEDSLLGIRVVKSFANEEIEERKSFTTATTSLCASTAANTSIWPASTPLRASSTD